jgi:transposase InsO family protein
VNRFQFVADHCTTFEVKRLCTLVEIERSSYYAWLKAAPARRQRAAADAALAARIRAVHDDDKTQGAPRITAELNDGAGADAGAGERVNHKRVARVMREHGIAGYRRRRKVRTTVPEPADQKVPDLLNRDFTAPAPNRRYVGDITYLPLADGNNLYLATVIDCYSRRLAGWSITDHLRTELVKDALNAAAVTRGSLAGAIFHSDHGSQGGFNRSSQHLEHGGLRWGGERRSCRRRRRVGGGSGRRIERCDRRCVHRAGRSPRARCSVSSGG